MGVSEQLIWEQLSCDSGLVRYAELLRRSLLANTHTKLLSVIASSFPTVALDRGASSLVTALHIRRR